MEKGQAIWIKRESINRFVKGVVRSVSEYTANGGTSVSFVMVDVVNDGTWTVTQSECVTTPPLSTNIKRNEILVARRDKYMGELKRVADAVKSSQDKSVKAIAAILGVPARGLSSKIMAAKNRGLIA